MHRPRLPVDSKCIPRPLQWPLSLQKRFQVSVSAHIRNVLLVGLRCLELRLVVRGMLEGFLKAGAAITLSMLTWWCEAQGVLPNLSEDSPEMQITHSVSDAKLVPQHPDVASG